MMFNFKSRISTIVGAFMSSICFTPQEVKNLSVRFGQGEGSFLALDGFELTVAKGETVVLVGESGSGKSISALSMSRLLPSTALIESGSIEFAGSDLLGLPEKAMRNIRGAGIGMVFQEPQSSLNPVMTIGSQIGESLKRHHGLYGKALLERIEELLVLVGISNPKHRCRQYPHEFSGGMKQRVMIAIALAGDPELLIADEPTTALDVTTQVEVLAAIRDIIKKFNTAAIYITHDLAVVAQMADKIKVIRYGKEDEEATTTKMLSEPKQEYTKSLWSVRSLTKSEEKSSNIILSLNNSVKYSSAISTPEEIDRYGLTVANFMAMKRSLYCLFQSFNENTIKKKLNFKVYVDGSYKPDFSSIDITLKKNKMIKLDTHDLYSLVKGDEK